MTDLPQLKTIFRDCIPFLVALGDETRLAIIQQLFEFRSRNPDGDIPGLNVKEITERTHLSRPAVSHHLKILKDTGLVDIYPKGVRNYYYLTGENCTRQLMLLGRTLQELPQITGETGQTAPSQAV